MMFVFVLISNTDIEKVGLFTSSGNPAICNNLPCAHLSSKKWKKIKNTPPRAHVFYSSSITGIIIFIAPFNNLNCINSNYNF